jgi:hypothetical protein
MTGFVESTSLKLYFHPFASFCQKALIAFYENHVPFEPIIVDLADEASRTAFKDMGRRRSVHAGGLCRRACAVLLELGDALR